MARKKIAIIHIYPLEYFPPITNLLDYISSNYPELRVSVYTTHNTKDRKVYEFQGADIKRYHFPEVRDNSFIKALKYLIFYLSTLFQLILKKPNTILYYETISSWPVYFYSKYINKNCEIFIHYHEYASHEWYKKFMKLVRYLYKLEVSYLYEKAIWISQTNKYRIQLFEKDNPNIQTDKLYVYPNYPPKEWKSDNEQTKEAEKIRVVYVGSLSIEGTYVEEFCNWVVSQSNIVFDIYSYNLHDEVRALLDQYKGEKIKFFDGGIEYYNIPEVLRNYDVGLIFYKDYSLNVRYCAPNKFFEYLICDLDVWFSKEMIGCQDFVTNETWPRVIPLDFKNLHNYHSAIYGNRKELRYKSQQYYSEDANEKMLDFMTKSRFKI